MFKSRVVEFQGLSERKGFKGSGQVGESYCNRLYRKYSITYNHMCLNVWVQDIHVDQPSLCWIIVILSYQKRLCYVKLYQVPPT